jgi:hypothetical protein
MTIVKSWTMQWIFINLCSAVKKVVGLSWLIISRNRMKSLLRMKWTFWKLTSHKRR